jgi:hypothetical protein
MAWGCTPSYEKMPPVRYEVVSFTPPRVTPFAFQSRYTALTSKTLAPIELEAATSLMISL